MNVVDRPWPTIPMARLKKGLTIKKLIYDHTIYGFVTWCHEVGISTSISKLNHGGTCSMTTAKRIAKGLNIPFDSIFDVISRRQQTWGNRFGYKLKVKEFKALLANRKLTVCQAAERCGVTATSIYDYLNEEKVARFKTAVLISDALRVPIESIFQAQDY